RHAPRTINPRSSWGSPALAPASMALVAGRVARALASRRRPGVSAAGDALHEAVAAECLGAVAPSALDQSVVEDRLVVILPGDHDDLVPHAPIDDPFVVELRAKALGVDGGKRVAGAIHAPTAVAAADDCDELVCL